MGIFRKYINQTRKPEGLLGRLMIDGMNSGHKKLAEWGRSHLAGIPASAILELGCGGGLNAGELLSLYPEAELTALDYSELSVERTKEHNRKAIEEGRCTVVQGNVASLPFASDAYDLATAFETVYFWPGLEKCFSQVCRVLKKGGAFLICNESDGKDETSLKFESMIDGMKCYTPEALSDALKAAGFSETEARHHPSEPWITVLARK